MALQWFELNCGFVCVYFSFTNIEIFDPIRSRIMNAINRYCLLAKYISIYRNGIVYLFTLLMELLRRFLGLKNVINHKNMAFERCRSIRREKNGGS